MYKTKENAPPGASKGLMAHLVLGYPTLPDSIRSAESYIAAGCNILELQIPFSHPTADGPLITAACREAVENQHVQVEDCLAALQWLRARYPKQEIMVMSYANRVYTYGAGRFVSKMEQMGVRHLIIPDLPIDSPLSDLFSLKSISGKAGSGVSLVPVLAANISPGRLQSLMRLGCEFFYLMSDFKITGSDFSLHTGLLQIISTIREANPGARIGIGFGISTPGHVRAVLRHADVAIVGSALIKAQIAGNLAAYLGSLTDAVRAENRQVHNILFR